MIASLPIEATRARFQTRPSNGSCSRALIALFAQLISAQEDDETGGDNRGLQITREVGGTEELGKELIRPIRSCSAVRRSIALNGDAVGRQPDAKPQAMFLPTPPLANLRVSLHPELPSGLAPRSQAAACC